MRLPLRVAKMLNINRALFFLHPETCHNIQSHFFSPCRWPECVYIQPQTESCLNNNQYMCMSIFLSCLIPSILFYKESFKSISKKDKIYAACGGLMH